MSFILKNNYSIVLLIFINCLSVFSFSQVNVEIEKPEINQIILKSDKSESINGEVVLESDIKNLRGLNLNSNTELIQNLIPDSNINNPINQTSIGVITYNRNGKVRKSKYPIQKSFNLNTLRSTMGVPTNDLPCNATVIDLSGSGCAQDEGTGNQDATPDYYGGCIQPNHNSVWYKFVITSGNDYLTAELTSAAGKEIEAMLVSGDCTGSPDGDFVGTPTLISSNCALSPFTFEFWDLAPGTYYLMFSTQPGSNQLSDFEICFTQSPAPQFVTGPEQDCAGAIPVCDLDFTQDVSYTGYWETDEIPNNSILDDPYCLAGGEHNSVWYVFTPQTTGTLNFTLETANDYDWAIYNLTSIGGCGAISSSAPIRCNYSGTNGNTGISAAGILTAADANDSPWCSTLNVTAGNTYVLIIDNYTSDANGYDLHFSGTASIADRPPATGAFPTMTSASSSCTSNTITIDMSEYVTCLTILAADFTLTNTTTSSDMTSHIVSVTGTNCTNSDITNQLILTHDGSLTTGSYTIDLIAGRVLADKCGNLADESVTVSFNYLSSLTLSASDATICNGEAVTLTATGANGYSYNLYTLNPGGITDASNPDDGVFAALYPTITTIYTVSATYGGCTKTANATVTVEGNIITTIDPPYKTICSGTTILTANTTVNGAACVGCIYEWSTTETTSSITVAPGTYTVTVNTSTGCSSSNVPTATVVAVSAGTGGGSCDVIYVSPTGGGDGYSKGAPTTLADAITKAQCTNAIIKMKRGIYTFSDYQVINDYVTIEGGFNDDFSLKYSNLSGGANSTTIVRSNAADSGSPTKCSAFVASDGTSDFRIQDVRIELPGCSGCSNTYSHAAGSGIANYGIRLGTSCSNYNIIRCYIDAGIGAMP